jgi:hypothetical protein
VREKDKQRRRERETEREAERETFFFLGGAPRSGGGCVLPEGGVEFPVRFFHTLVIVPHHPLLDSNM